ncbi:MAG: protein kinase [Desulfohalobiaceae bacterium]|nr:protein kinase [Desulfohalobiaceae bacterium]
MNTSSQHNQILEEGQVVAGKWEILRFIARGGKGEVYQARQLNLDRYVAVKVMSREFLQSLEGREEEYTSELQRFRREVTVMARIRHPNVLQVYDFDQLEVGDTKLDYIVMEYVPGSTLRQTMPEEGFGRDEKSFAKWFRRYFLPVLKGMEAVHAQGVIHRDMKPENVLIDDGVPKITDFGLAGGHYLGNITRSFHIIGTPPYMPEEQFLDLAMTDARADVYALGKILYEAIEGKMTQERNKPFENVHLSNPESKMLRGLDRIVRNATAKDRNLRTSTVKALHEELSDILAESGHDRLGRSTSAHKRQVFLLKTTAGILIILLLGLGLYHLNMDGQPGQKDTVGQENVAEQSSDRFNFDFQTRDPTPLPELPPGGDWPSRIEGSDGADLHLVPGGEVEVPLGKPDNGGQNLSRRTFFVAPFYMDESKVTNHLYVEFLRQIEGLEVVDGTVRKNGRIWLFLGEVRDGYEPIAYRNDGFVIKHDAVSKPVVRVTPFGAMAYARFHGRALPSMAHWWRAVLAGGDSLGPSPQTGVQGNGGEEMMMHHEATEEAGQADTRGEDRLQPVFDVPANRLGIRGLTRNVNEWTLLETEAGKLQFHIHGGNGELDQLESYLERKPWEAFAGVGFRTVLPLPAKENRK